MDNEHKPSFISALPPVAAWSAKGRPGDPLVIDVVPGSSSLHGLGRGGRLLALRRLA